MDLATDKGWKFLGTTATPTAVTSSHEYLIRRTLGLPTQGLQRFRNVMVSMIPTAFLVRASVLPTLINLYIAVTRS